MATTAVLGIRHHGPGSARAALEALERNPPAALAVEMPADLAPLLAHVGHTQLAPPVALTAYDPKDVRRALYYPLARFSPEWVAMRWAAARGVPVVPIDLPAGLTLSLTERDRARLDRDLAADARAARVRRDPLGELARLAGYRDRERWWERTFELENPGADVFAATAELIAELREAYPAATDAECRLREMHMARELQRLRREHAGHLAVVCGAWHAPALAEDAWRATAKGFAAAKQGLRAVRLELAWIPWTYERLRTRAGYGAGVGSPVWYGLLFDDPRAATGEYLTLLARELRVGGYAASTAQVVDALELTESLTQLRDLRLPGLEELREAARGTLCEGSAARLEEVLARVESLRTTGRVPEALNTLPLQRDLEARLREVRLLKPYREMEPARKTLDVRKPAHLQASQLLSRLLLLGIPFGDRDEASAGARGTFREDWRLHWRPEFQLSLLAAHVHGSTVEVAAAGALRARLGAEAELASLTAGIDLAILAGLLAEVPAIAARIRRRTAEVEDAWTLASALPPLFRTARYRSLRVAETETLDALVAVLLPKLSAALPSACAGIDDEAAYAGFTALKRLHPYVSMAAADLHDQYLHALEAVAFGTRTHALLAGFALRALTDAGRLAPGETARWLRRSLGSGLHLAASGQFAEGFLFSSALVLLHQPSVLRAFDAWLTNLPLDGLRALLPALRRTFAAFPVSERRKLSALLDVPDFTDASETTPAGDEASTRLPPVLAAALGEWLG